MNPVLLVDEAIGCALHDQQKQYLEVHRNRYVYTLQALSKCLPVNKFLEIGSTAFFQQLVSAVSPLTEVYGTQFAAEPSFMESVAPFKGWGSFKYYLGNPELFQYIIKEESFDLVLCAEVIEHMAVDPMALLVEMNRVLSIGGQLVLTTPNVVGSRSILAALDQRMPFNFYAYNKNKSSDSHNIEYSSHLFT